MQHPRPTILCIYYNTTLMTAACSRNATRQPCVLYRCTIMGTHYNSIKSYCNYMYKICIYYSGVDKLLRPVSGRTVLLSGVRMGLLSSYTCSLSTECAHTILIISLVLFFTFSIRKIQGVRTRNYDLSYYKNIFSRVRSIFFFYF